MTQNRVLSILIVAGLAVGLGAGAAWGDSFLVSPYPGATVGQTALDGGSVTANGGFDVLADGSIVAQVHSNVNLYSADGAFVRTISSWTDGSGWFGAFARVNPAGDTVYFGITGDDASGKIYSAPLSGNGATATHVANLDGCFDLEFYGSDIFVAGLNTPWSGGTSDVTGIWRLDTSGNNQHDGIAQIGGNSAGLALDSQGRLLAGVYNSTQTSTAGVVAIDYAAWSSYQETFGQGTDTLYVIDDDDLLASTTNGLWDVAVDAADNVLFNANDPYYTPGASFIGLVESGKTYTPGDYDVLATGDPSGYGNWFTQMDATGNVLDGGAAYTGDFFSMPLGSVSVPEPSAILLLAMAALTLTLPVRSRRRARASDA
jgi:hypothetical protein